jgi:hypothetical protein
VLEELQAQELTRVVAFADSIFLQGSQEGVQTAFPSARMLLEPLSLQLTASKCSACSKGAGSEAVAQNLGIKHAAQGIVEVGSPGAASFCGGPFTTVRNKGLRLNGNAGRAPPRLSRQLAPLARVAAAESGAPSMRRCVGEAS